MTSSAYQAYSAVTAVMGTGLIDCPEGRKDNIIKTYLLGDIVDLGEVAVL